MGIDNLYFGTAHLKDKKYANLQTEACEICGSHWYSHTIKERRECRKEIELNERTVEHQETKED